MRQDHATPSLRAELLRTFPDAPLVGGDGVVFYLLRVDQQQADLLADLCGQLARVGEQAAAFRIFDRVPMRLALRVAANRERPSGVFVLLSVFTNLAIIEWHGSRSHWERTIQCRLQAFD
jgi:hypothetical protein